MYWYFHVKASKETFHIFLLFYKSSTDWQWNQKRKNYIQLDQLKKMKGTKGSKKAIKYK